MYKVLILVLGLLMISSAVADDKIPINPVKPPVLGPPMTLEDGLKTVDSETKVALAYLKRYVKEEDKNYIQFLTSYALPKEMRNDAALCASFLLHSLVGPSPDLDNNNAGGYYPLALIATDKQNGRKWFIPYQRVPGSTTLYWLDLRDYNLTKQSWEDAAGLDNYFAEPIVQHQNATSLRLEDGNSVLRMDWFIRHVADTSTQVDNDETPFLYYNFLFSQVEPPITVTQFEGHFTLNRELSRIRGNEYGVLVTQSQQVARNNRYLFYYDTEYGGWFHTFDVKNQRGERNYAESFFTNPKIGTPPLVHDASEVFGSNAVGMLVYGLGDDKDKLITDGATQVVRHINDVLGDVRVRTPHGCMDCHASGPLPSENVIKKFFKDSENTALYVKNKSDYNRVKRVFLSEKFDKGVLDIQKKYADALLEVNGLTPEENGRIYLDLVNWYEEPLDIKQAAFECGVSVDEFITKVNKVKFGNRLKFLTKTGEPIPRNTWEAPTTDGIPGDFQMANLAIHGFTRITETESIIINPEYSLKEDTWSMIKTDKIVLIPKDTVVKQLSSVDQWIYVKYNDKLGYVNLENLEVVNK